MLYLFSIIVYLVVFSGLQLYIAHSGERSKPVILTYHDLGLNYVSNYQTFFNYPEMKDILLNLYF